MERLLRRENAVQGGEIRPAAALRAVGQSLRVAAMDLAAERTGLRVGMAAADARALCPDLRALSSDPAADAAFARHIARWAGRYGPLAAVDAPPADLTLDRADALGREVLFQGLSLDVAGVGHLFGGEEALAADLSARLSRMGLTGRVGLADAKGAAWALARFGPEPLAARVAAPGQSAAAVRALPVAALRLEPDVADALMRLGVRRVDDALRLPRASLARRFGVRAAERLDQILGACPEPISPLRAAPRFSARLSLPEPIGLRADLDAALARLLERVCAQLAEAGRGARRLRLELRRVDRESLSLEVGLARPRRDAAFIAPLFDRALGEVDAGYGIDAMRLEATLADVMGATQTHAGPSLAPEPDAATSDAAAALLSRLGGRLGFEALSQMRPGQSHAPDRAVIFEAAAAADARPGAWPPAAAARPERPVERVASEPIEPLEPGETALRPPKSFRWRGARRRVVFAAGPERIAPEWWLDDPAWRSGVRDYWRIETEDGLRLWLYVTPQTVGDARAASWRVAGVFA